MSAKREPTKLVPVPSTNRIPERDADKRSEERRVGKEC